MTNNDLTNHNSSWTDLEEAALVETLRIVCNSGKPPTSSQFKIVGNKIGRSLEAVRGRWSKMVIEDRVSPEDITSIGLSTKLKNKLTRENSNIGSSEALIRELLEEQRQMKKDLHELRKESGLESTEGLNFSEALAFIKEGKKVKRAHWGGCWFYVEKSDLSWQDPNEEYPRGLTLNPTIIARLKDNGGFVPASPYQEDLLAEDWEIVD